MTLFELCFKQLIKDSEFFGMNNEICIENMVILPILSFITHNCYCFNELLSVGM